MEPLPEAGFLPGVKVHFVEAAKALGVKEADDVHVRASAGEHGVKVCLDGFGKAGYLAARFF